jgi:hypothetical protein
VAGYSDTATTITFPCPGHYKPPRMCSSHPQHAFLYSNGTMADLGSLGGADKGSSGDAIENTALGLMSGCPQLSARPTARWGPTRHRRYPGRCRERSLREAAVCSLSSSGVPASCHRLKAEPYRITHTPDPGRSNHRMVKQRLLLDRHW